MILHKVLESLFGSPAKIRLLRVLLASPQPLSGRQIGELSGLSHRGAILALESLVELGAVRQRRVGKSYQYSMARGNITVEKIIAPCIRAEAELFDGLKRAITEQFAKNAVSLALYGSLVRGTEKRGSDIDVLAVVRDARMKAILEEKVASLVPFFHERFNALLSLHCFTLREIRGKKTLPLIQSVMKEGVTLSGKPISGLLK